MNITFHFKDISIHLFPDKGLCFILMNGFCIWSGDKDELIDLLKSIPEVPNEKI